MVKPTPKAKGQLLSREATLEAADWIRLRDQAMRYLDSIAIETEFPQIGFTPEFQHSRIKSGKGMNGEMLIVPKATAVTWLHQLIEQADDAIRALGVEP